jgi:hypothetical protein
MRNEQYASDHGVRVERERAGVAAVSFAKVMLGLGSKTLTTLR